MEGPISFDKVRLVADQLHFDAWFELLNASRTIQPDYSAFPGNVSHPGWLHLKFNAHTQKSDWYLCSLHRQLPKSCPTLDRAVG